MSRCTLWMPPCVLAAVVLRVSWHHMALRRPAHLRIVSCLCLAPGTVRMQPPGDPSGRRRAINPAWNRLGSWPIDKRRLSIWVDTGEQTAEVAAELRFIKFRLISRVYQLEPALNLRESHCLSPDSTTSATPLGDPWVRLCAVPCLAGGPSPDILAPFSLALPWEGVPSHACSGGS